MQDDGEGVCFLTQDWAAEAVKRAVALGKTTTKTKPRKGGKEGGKEGGREGGVLKPPSYKHCLYVDPAEVAARKAAEKEKEEQAAGGGEGKETKRLREDGKWVCMGTYERGPPFPSLPPSLPPYPYRRRESELASPHLPPSPPSSLLPSFF